ncbi:choline-sulfatase [Microbacterium sp. STN6]|uniref:choline-sulfatase n=1 Tax=Microbacterium sp. STN6 TaxID=2995588 RepID=UPI00226093A8|nr:choline-sulfatase [Microbacterium sp. STN6]MCX7522418.1 choline-sulfatase [Microbacterium sp. STN6]
MTAPNILIVMADQVVPFLTSPYGDRVAKTPAMQRLADEGVTFEAAYTAAPLCSPSRAALVAGRYPSSMGCFDNASVFPADQPCLAHYLAAAGYDTLASGKMHFVGPDQLHGFDRRLTTDVFPAGVDWVPTLDENGRFPAGGHARHYVDPDPGVRDWTMFMAYDEETQFRALEYLRERHRTDAQQPFGMVVSFHHPHDPFHVQQEYWDLYDDADMPLPEYPDDLEQTYSAMDRWANDAHETDVYDVRDEQSMRHLRHAYYAALSYVDRKLGELLDTLAVTGALENTVVLFTSDHGDMLGERGMVQKRAFYEWSVRVPLVLRMPQAALAATRVPQPVSLVDVLPTLLDLAGVAPAVRAELHGRSLVGLMDGAAAEPGVTPDTVPVFSEYHLEKVHAPCFMVRRGRHKYIYIHGHDERLFDLENDPGEWHDLAVDPAHAGLVAELRALIFDRFDPEALAARGAASIRDRVIVRDGMAANGTHWDYQPRTDATWQYVR